MAKQKSLLGKLPVKTGVLTKALSAAATDAEQRIVIRVIVDPDCCVQLRDCL